MRTTDPRRAESLEHLLRTLCRCDGLKDLAVVTALVVIFGSLAVRLCAAPQVVNTFL